jgi:outer membrane receptor for ferrienterochelin and colicin
MEFRLKASAGHLVTKADIAQSGASVWVDAVRLVPGVQVLVTPMRAGSPMQLRRLSMRGAAGRCTPAVYLNGLHQGMGDFDWENFVTLESIERIEVYSAANVPLQFRPTGSSCGSVLIWTTKER